MREALKFLLFMEDNPKHYVIEKAITIEMWLVVTVPMLALFMGLILWAYVCYALLGVVVAYVAVIVLLIEIPHILLDRPR